LKQKSQFTNAVNIDWIVLLKLQGENLQRGVQLADYSVTIGSEQCVVENLTSNVLYCQPPFVEPPLNGSTDHFCTKIQLNAVKVVIICVHNLVISNERIVFLRRMHTRCRYVVKLINYFTSFTFILISEISRNRLKYKYKQINYILGFLK